MTLPPSAFASSLSRFAGRWRGGLLVVALLGTLAASLLLCIAFGLFDYVAPFSDAARPTVSWALVSLVVLAGLRSLLPLQHFSTRDAAARADARHEKRRPVTTALELAATATADDAPLRQFLVGRAQVDGARVLEQLPPAFTLPWPLLKKTGWVLAGVLVMVAGLCAVNYRAVGTIAARLMRPGADIPPYSVLSFEVTPAQPKVVYGSDADLEVKIIGGPAPQGVVMLTRPDHEAAPSETGTFAMGEGRFGQRLQRVVQPVEVAFATGRLRSRWITVEVMRQPRVESVIIKVKPPAYAKLPVKEFALGTSELVALAGSEIEARITSNRPLSGATVTIAPPRSVSRDKPETFESHAGGDKQVVLRWKVRNGGLVRMDLRDITGALSATPVEIEQKLLPDNPPEATLISPGGLTLATPESEVPLEVSVEDDLGIGRVDLVRKLSGFRDRGRLLEEDGGERTYGLHEKLVMKSLGVSPGQTLELYVEAHDYNPSLMGIGSSPASRIQIISTAEYASLMRARTSMAEFQARFAALNESLKAVRQALAKAAENGDAAEAMKAMEHARQLAEAMSKDFVAFDAEKQVAEAAKKIAAQMQQMQEQLAKAGAGRAADEARKQIAELGEAASQTQQLKEQGSKMAAVGRVLEMAAEFKAMHADQQKLTKQLEQLAREIMAGDMRNAAKLDSLARAQKTNLDRWKQWLPELKAAADALPPGFEDLKEQAQQFAKAADDAGVQRAMERAMEQSKKNKTPDTFVNSQLALVGMDTLLNGGNRFGKTCKDGKPGFMCPDDLASTFAQMLDGMCRKRGQGAKPGGQGMAEASGGGMGADSGYSTQGDPLMAAPVYGPDRMAFTGDSSLRGQSEGRGKNGKGSVTVQADAANSLDAKATRQQAKRQISLRDVPERYRDAVRRFYGEDAVKETSASKEDKP